MSFIMNKKVFLFLLVLPSFAKAQVNDAGLWTSINLDKKINKQFTINFTEELRFNENISELGNYFSEFSLEYKFNKMISASVGYRFIQKRNLDGYYSKRHRFISEIAFKKKLRNLAVNLKLKYQSQYSNYYSSETGKIPDQYLRTKLQLKYDLNKRYTPSISGESFYFLNSKEGVLFNNYRLTIGFNYEFSKKSSLDLAYLINKEIQVNDPWTSYITSIGWNYSF
ncbi:DUF2490 domain-containing protein [soil metagenome]